MMFLPELDINATKANAKRKLREYPRWRRIANDIDKQKITSSFSFEPRQKYSSPNKAVETIAINRVDAELELEAIEQAVNGIDDQLLRKIIYLKYLSPQKVRDKEIYMDMLYSETFFYNKLSEAIVCFAEIYRGGELLCWKI
ncbi:ArpU family phage packaging/lysis transcriptional regulator [Streptococcus uberis]|uniref:ArpU family phage packaging/lysis transcriptional regulator n=1 Tax=Streptococcus uberis TaxID=1349 RepID=UPI0015F16B61|nr:ArpU family phage packaging/lysis transcriptional regulator [Streptococcus uberis]MCK1191456.1 ArpU family transcriptional regulator [Streptococcus uberis]MCK1200460.1 ArpU family transcriptional regulator [Streptococcus uberis]MCK1209669.1 ArpU family transcriptional regulator [Streptococcus uberis]MCK1222339.1 ArpU family transcriptional regulator [Streptococcus uberis]MCK1231605.1 ArpU family transcriptional regulator [Streptococcus uberis]